MKKILLLTLLLLPFIACGNDEEIYTLSNWEVLFNENPSLKKVESNTGWRSIKLPNVFHLPATENSDYQHLWLRNNFVVTSPEKYYGVCLGRVFYSDTVYLNGTKIGNHNFDEVSMLPRRRNYTIPPGLLKKGDNQLYIYIGTFGFEQAGITSDIALKPKSSFHFTRLLSDFVYIHLPLEILLFSIISFGILIILFVWNPGDRLYLYSSFAVLIYAVLLASMFLTFRDVSPRFIQFIHWSSLQYFSIALILIIQSLYGIYVKKTNLRYISFLAGIILIILYISLFSKTQMIKHHNIISLLAMATIIIMTPVYFRTIMMLNRLKPDKFKLIILSLISAAGLAVAAIEVYYYMIGGRLTLLLVTFCSPFFLLIFSMIFARERMKIRLELKAIYSVLKKNSPGGNNGLIADSTDSSETLINEISRGKLDQVVKFIESNYTSDLSREGLAAAVGMNPNYMSGLFKTYTGSKINEYINTLRIEDASKRLEDRNTKIIEVAYAVGFESLSTFNRVFKKQVGKTPSEYRENI